jgi:hypothetical protein
MVGGEYVYMGLLALVQLHMTLHTLDAFQVFFFRCG